MVLTVDIGNTKTALGVWNGSELVTSMQASTTAPRDWVAWALGAVPKGGGRGNRAGERRAGGQRPVGGCRSCPERGATRV